MSNVLVVDDDQGVLEVIKSMLEEAGHCVGSVSPDGSRAKDILRSEKFDVLVLDYHLPRTNAPELADYARNLGVAVVMISGDQTLKERVCETELTRHLWL